MPARDRKKNQKDATDDQLLAHRIGYEYAVRGRGRFDLVLPRLRAPEAWAWWNAGYDKGLQDLAVMRGRR